jgi:hypothetical protein
MTVDVWVENHQPTALRPLLDLEVRRGSLLYIGRRVTLGGDCYEGSDAPGWVVFDGQDGYAPVADPLSAWYDERLDWGASLGRVLAPGESLHIRYGS